MATTNRRNPVLIVTSSRWSQEPYVVFDDDEIIGNLILDEWIDDLMYDSDNDDEDSIPTRDEIAEGMVDDFFAENTDIDEFWPLHNICRAGSGYFEYDDTTGTGNWIDEDDALEKMPEILTEKIKSYQLEQSVIANAGVITPRQANVTALFGVNANEQSALADDKTILRCHNNVLYVYESQLGEPAQWRLLQPRPHMPTGTLRRPSLMDED